MSNIDKRAFAMTKELATLMVERFSMNPVSSKLLNEAWHKEFPDEVAIAKRMLALLDELEDAEKRIAEMQALASGVKQFSEFQICHYGATEDYAKGYIDCQNNYNKVLFAAAGKGE